MRQREYQFIFFLNISHSFYSETELGKKHSHTWELEVTMHPKKNELVQFREAELVITDYLKKFQDKYLNRIAPFHRMNPSIENFLDRVAGEIDIRMQEKDWEVKELRISENPTRTYMIDRQRMDEVRGLGDSATDEIAAREVAASVEMSEQQNGMSEQQNGMAAGKVADIAPQKSEKIVKAADAEAVKREENVQPASKPVVRTDELQVKTQTVGNTTRIVITIP